MWAENPKDLPIWEGKRCGPKASQWNGVPGKLYFHPVLKLAVVGRRIGKGKTSFLRACELCDVGTRSIFEPRCTKHGGLRQPRAKCVSKGCLKKSHRKGGFCDMCYAARIPKSECKECGQSIKTTNEMCQSCTKWTQIKTQLRLPDCSPTLLNWDDLPDDVRASTVANLLGENYV